MYEILSQPTSIVEIPWGLPWRVPGIPTSICGDTIESPGEARAQGAEAPHGIYTNGGGAEGAPQRSETSWPMLTRCTWACRGLAFDCCSR